MIRMSELKYMEDRAVLLPMEYFAEAYEADSIWGQGYRDMEYRGSIASKRQENGWHHVTDYFTDKNGKWWWHGRYAKRTPEGKYQYATSSQAIFGKYIREWEAEGKRKK